MIEISLVLIPNCINKVVKETRNDAIARKEEVSTDKAVIRAGL